LLLLVAVLIVLRIRVPLHVPHVSEVMGVRHVILFDVLVVSIHVPMGLLGKVLHLHHLVLLVILNVVVHHALVVILEIGLRHALMLRVIQGVGI
jgi:hypothetical protein